MMFLFSAFLSVPLLKLLHSPSQSCLAGRGLESGSLLSSTTPGADVSTSVKRRISAGMLGYVDEVAHLIHFQSKNMNVRLIGDSKWTLRVSPTGNRAVGFFSVLGRTESFSEARINS